LLILDLKLCDVSLEASNLINIRKVVKLG